MYSVQCILSDLVLAFISHTQLVSCVSPGGEQIFPHLLFTYKASNIWEGMSLTSTVMPC